MKPVSRNILIVTVTAVLGLAAAPVMARGGGWGDGPRGNCVAGQTAGLWGSSSFYGGTGAAAQRNGRMGAGRNTTGRMTRSATPGVCDGSGPCGGAGVAPSASWNNGTPAIGNGGRGRWN